MQFIISLFIKNFTLYQPGITNFTHSRSEYISTSHLQSTFSFFLTAHGRSEKNFSIPGVTQEILNSPRLFIPLINIRNKKMKS